MPRNRSIALASLLALSGCRSVESEPETNPPPLQPDPESDPDSSQDSNPIPPIVETPQTFEQALSDLEDDGIDGFAHAAELFRSGAYFEDAQDVSVARREALDALLAYASDTATTVEDQVPLAAGCARVGFCDAGQPTPEEVEIVEAFESKGLVVMYGGEGTVLLAPDVAWWQQTLDDVLEPAERLWLETSTLEQRASNYYDEDGYGGPVSVLADVALAYERLAALDHPAYTQEANEMICGAQAVLLSSCDHGEWETPNCSITKKERAEWDAMIESAPESSTARISKAFLKRMKAKRYRASTDEVHAIIASLLPCVEP